MSDDQTRTILRARAAQLRRPPVRLKTAGEAFEVVEFHLARERYGIEQSFVREVCPLKDLTPVPCTPPFVLGIINVRGQILPVIDIKKFFELPESGINDIHAVIIVQVDHVELGVLADAVTNVRSIPVGSYQTSLPTLTGIRAKYLKGVTDDHLVLLDITAIVSDPKIIVDEGVEAL